MHINHLLITFDFKASQCTCSIFFLFFFEKTQWTKWIVSLWERAARRFMFIHYATALLRPFLFSYFFFLASTPPIWKQTFTNLQTHQSIPVHIKIPELDNKLKVKFSKTHEIEAWASSRCENFFSYRFLSNTRSFSFHFLHNTLSALHTSRLSPAPASVSFLSLSSTRVNTVKFTWCPVGMWICESSRRSHFLFFFSFFFWKAWECWLLLGSRCCDHFFFFLNPLFCTKSNSKEELHVKWQWWYERSSSSWGVALLLF